MAGSLAGRQEAIRLAVEALSGNEAEFETVSGGRRGKLKGKVAEATVDGFALLMELKQGRRVVGETRMAVKWSDLAHEEEDRLARKGGWEAKGADAAMARAVLAKARGQMKAASAALAEAGDHPLAETYRMRIGAAETQAAYDAAMDRARSRMRSKNWKGAAKALEEALAARPDDADATKLLVEAESHIGPAPTLTLDLGRGVTMEFVYIKPGRFRGDAAARGGDHARFLHRQVRGDARPVRGVRERNGVQDRGGEGGEELGTANRRELGRYRRGELARPRGVRAGRHAPGDVRELERCESLQRVGDGEDAPRGAPADGGGMGVCLPGGDDDAVLLWRPGRGSGRVRLVQAELGLGDSPGGAEEAECLGSL